MTLAYRGMDLRPWGATLAPMTPRRAHLALGLFVLVAMLSLIRRRSIQGFFAQRVQKGE